MPRCTGTVIHCLRSTFPGQQTNNPIAMFYPGICFLLYFRISANSMQYFCPIPLRTVLSLISCIVFFRARHKNMIQFLCFPRSRMVFPQMKHRVFAFCKFLQQCQRRSMYINRNRRRTGCINPNTADFADYFFIQRPKRFFYTFFQRFHVIQWMLSENIFFRMLI